MTSYDYNFDFASGLGAWRTWMAPSVQSEVDGLFPEFVRLHAPGDLDPNHIDGIGPIWLVAHLSTAGYGSPGTINLVGASIDITIRATDFEAHGAQLAFWAIRYLPEQNVYQNYYVGLQSTNWAFTGGDFVDELATTWKTIHIDFTNDPADWTYAGNNVTSQGDWAYRYVPFDLDQTISEVDATLHLVLIGDDPNRAPRGFLDIASLTIHTSSPATPSSGQLVFNQSVSTLEDTPYAGQLTVPVGINAATATFTIVQGSMQNGVVAVDQATGTFVFNPDPNFWGPDRDSNIATFSYTVSDGVSTTSARSVLINVSPVNDAPEAFAANEDVAIAADQPFTHTLRLGVDLDRGEKLTYAIVAGSVQNGSMALDAHTGIYTFIPDAGFSGTASFSYFVTDGQAASGSKVVNIEVAPAGSPPILPDYIDNVIPYLSSGDMETFVYWTILLAEAGDPHASLNYGTWLMYGQHVTQDTAHAVQILAQAAVVEPAAKLLLAELYIAGNGVTRNYSIARSLLESLQDNGQAQYKLGLLDDLGYGQPADHALALQHYLTAAELGNADAMYVLGRRYLTGTGSEVQPTDAYFWLGMALKFNGGPNLAQFDDLLYFNRGQAAASLTAEEEAALDAAIALWLPGDPTPVNDAPLANSATEDTSAYAGSAYAGTLLSGTDRDGDKLTYAAVQGSSLNGTVNINANTGRYVFTTTPGFIGTGSFAYLISDGQSNSTPKIVTIDYLAATTGVNDTASSEELQTIQVFAATGVLANDVAETGGVLSVAAANGSSLNVGQPLSGTYGTLTLFADGSYIYRASAATLIQGQTVNDVFVYEISDGLGHTSNATLTITITGAGGTVVTGDGQIGGSAFDDLLTGGTGHDIILAFAGNDTLIGGDGAANELYGYAGDDVYIVTAFGDTIVESAGDGIDEVRTSLTSFVQRDHVENLTYIGAVDFLGVGNGHDNVIKGSGGNDQLFGSAGQDTLVGGGGGDFLDGGDDLDIVDYSAGSAGIAINLSTNQNNGDDAEGDRLYNIEDVRGTGYADTLTGNTQNNTLIGGGGDDVIAGGYAAANTLIGGIGDDTYLVSAEGDTLVEFDREGTDSVYTALSSLVLGANLENLAYAGFANFVGIGNDLDNVLMGGAGMDTLSGGEGNDTLIGGSGLANTLIGGAGNDTYIVSAFGDTLLEYLGEGTDTVLTALHVLTMRANVENLTFTGTGSFLGIGNTQDNVIVGGAATDTFIGNGGNDTLVGGSVLPNTLIGGLGDDTYVVSAFGDTLLENVGEGTDIVVTSMHVHTLRSNIENLTYTGSTSFVGIGNELDNVIVGGAASDTLKGLDGNDRLTGGSGAANTMMGGTGDDIYVVTALGDTLIEAPDEGTDTVVTTQQSMGLRANFENLTYTGNLSFTGNGNGLNNVLTGGGGNDILTGFAGGDTFCFLANFGQDMIADFEDGLDSLSFAGLGDTSHFIVTGNGTTSVILTLLSDPTHSVTVHSTTAINIDDGDFLLF